MGAYGSRNRDGIDVRITDQFHEAGRSLHGWITPLHRFELAGVEIRHGANRGTRRLRKVSHQVWAPVAVTDDADFHHITLFSRDTSAIPARMTARPTTLRSESGSLKKKTAPAVTRVKVRLTRMG